MHFAPELRGAWGRVGGRARGREPRCRLPRPGWKPPPGGQPVDPGSCRGQDSGAGQGGHSAIGRAWGAGERRTPSAAFHESWRAYRRKSEIPKADNRSPRILDKRRSAVTLPRIRLSDEQIKKIVAGKNKRGVHHRDRITDADLVEMLEYTSLELIGLVDMMTSLRQGHRAAIAHAFPGRPILDPKRWWGPGASAEIMLDLMLGIEPCPPGPPGEDEAAKRERKKKWTALMSKNRREVLGDVTTESEPLRWARHAFFGGRIDPPMAGKTDSATYDHDLTSA